MHALDLLCFAPVFQFSRGAMRAFAETPGAVTVLAEAQSAYWQASASRSWKIAPAMWSRWMWLPRGAAAALRSVSWPWSRPNSTPPEPKKWSCTSSPATQKQSVSTVDRLHPGGHGNRLLRAEPARVALPQNAPGLEFLSPTRSSARSWCRSRTACSPSPEPVRRSSLLAAWRSVGRSSAPGSPPMGSAL